MAKKLKEVIKAKTAEVSTSNFDRVSSVIADLNKHYGKKLIKTGDDIPKIKKVPFGEPALDYVSDGGIPIGRMTEFLGQEHSGKTRNALRVMSKFQKYCFSCDTPDAISAVWELDKNNSPSLKSCSCSNCEDPKTNIQVLIDIEGTTDPLFMENFGIDVNGVIYVRPDMPSQAIGIVDTFLREPQIGLILLDSIGSMGADKEIENAIEDNKMNQNALFFNQAIRKWQMAFNSNTNETGKENGTTMIVINQSYVTLSIFSTEVAQGGRGLRHGKAMSLKTRIKERNKDEKTKKVFGVHVEYKNEKNKTGIPYRVKEYYLNLDPLDVSVPYCQTNLILQYIELAIDMGVVQQRGGWFEFDGRKWQGKGALLDDFDDSIKEAVDKIIYKKENS